MSINLQLPDIQELKPKILVAGVGGAGGNAVNNMITSGLEGVEFVVANTDAQALSMSQADRLIQLGINATEGLGAGSHPEVGAAAAEEVIDEIRDHLTGVHMIFITAGMGGGTGTGAAPVVARVARELGILTVGVVTKPFHFEGKRRMALADGGIKELKEFVDTLIVIPNQNLFRVANEQTTFSDAFAMADQVLYSGVACITDLMVKEGLINLDFADVRSVMRDGGKAMMGTGEANGDNRAIEAAESAIANPLLDDVSMIGARGALVSISGGRDLRLYEVDEAANRIREEVDNEANIIVGATFDDTLEGVMRVSVVATGVDLEDGLNASTEKLAALAAQGSIRQSITVPQTAPAVPLEAISTPEPAPKADVSSEDNLLSDLDLQVPAAPAQPAVTNGPQVRTTVPAPAPIVQPTSADNLPNMQKAAQTAQRLAQPKAPDQQQPRPQKSGPQVRRIEQPDARQFMATRPIEQPMPAEPQQREPYLPPMTQRPQQPQQKRMPRTEDFPVPARAQIEAAKTQGQDPHGLEAEKSRVGFFDRISQLGAQKKRPLTEQTAIPAQRPVSGAQQGQAQQGQAQQGQAPQKRAVPQRPQQAAPKGQQAPNHQAQQQGEIKRPDPRAYLSPNGATRKVQTDSEELDIPAFLRRR